MYASGREYIVAARGIGHKTSAVEVLVRDLIFDKRKRWVSLVSIEDTALGLDKPYTFESLVAAATAHGWSLCEQEVGLALRITRTKNGRCERLSIASKPLVGTQGRYALVVRRVLESVDRPGERFLGSAAAKGKCVMESSLTTIRLDDGDRLVQPGHTWVFTIGKPRTA